MKRLAERIELKSPEQFASMRAAGLVVARALEARGHDVARVVFGKDPIDLTLRAAEIDVAFLALHGRGGEDGEDLDVEQVPVGHGEQPRSGAVAHRDDLPLAERLDGVPRHAAAHPEPRGQVELPRQELPGREPPVRRLREQLAHRQVVEAGDRVIESSLAGRVNRGVDRSGRPLKTA